MAVRERGGEVRGADGDWAGAESAGEVRGEAGDTPVSPGSRRVPRRGGHRARQTPPLPRPLNLRPARACAPPLLAVAAINLPETHHLAPELRLVALSSPEEGIDLRC